MKSESAANENDGCPLLPCCHQPPGHSLCRKTGSEREAGQMQLRRGFQINEGERAIVVEDVITTGGSTREVIGVWSSLVPREKIQTGIRYLES